MKAFTFLQTDKKVLLENWRKFFGSTLFCSFQLLAACLFVLAGQEVAGAAFFGALIGVLLLVCEDTLPTTLPFLLISAFTTNCYDSFNLFIGFAKLAPVALLVLGYHFVKYRKPFETDKSIYGIMAVSLAVLLGGVGRFSVSEYFNGAYYLLGLSLGMILAYCLMKSRFSGAGDGEFAYRFAVTMTTLGLHCCFIVLSGYFKNGGGA